MRIINALFARGLGGIEQAYVDYGIALRQRGHEVMQLCHPTAAIIPKLDEANLHYTTISNRGQWDLFASQRLKRVVTDFHPDLLIAHGNRAISLLHRVKGQVPLTGVAHNYRLKRFGRLDGAFTVTDRLRDELIHRGLPTERVFTVPNMIAIADELPPPRAPGDIPHIATIGRMIRKKGFDVFLKALGQLKHDGIAFRATLGGHGGEYQRLLQRRHLLQLEDTLAMPGWVDEPDRFLSECDIFCLPSLQEPFGIVLLEAMRAGCCIVATKTDGPLAMIRHEENGLLVPTDDPDALARAFKQLICWPDKAHAMAKQAQADVRAHFSQPVVASILHKAVEHMVQSFASPSSSQQYE